MAVRFVLSAVVFLHDATQLRTFDNKLGARNIRSAVGKLTFNF